jgi:hypothetical protein
MEVFLGRYMGRLSLTCLRLLFSVCAPSSPTQLLIKLQPDFVTRHARDQRQTRSCKRRNRHQTDHGRRADL